MEEMLKTDKNEAYSSGAVKSTKITKFTSYTYTTQLVLKIELQIIKQIYSWQQGGVGKKDKKGIKE